MFQTHAINNEIAQSQSKFRDISSKKISKNFKSSLISKSNAHKKSISNHHVATIESFKNELAEIVFDHNARRKRNHTFQSEEFDDFVFSSSVDVVKSSMNDINSHCFRNHAYQRKWNRLSRSSCSTNLTLYVLREKRFLLSTTSLWRTRMKKELNKTTTFWCRSHLQHCLRRKSSKAWKSLFNRRRQMITWSKESKKLLNSIALKLR